MQYIIKINGFLLALFLAVFSVSTVSFAEGANATEKEAVKAVLQIASDDRVISYVQSSDASFAAIITMSAIGSNLSFYILEKHNGNWDVAACNDARMLREYDPLCLPQLYIGPHGSEEQPQNEIYIVYESIDFVGWNESITVKKSQTGWSIDEYAFYSLENHPYCPFYLFVIDDPIDPEFGCLAQCSYCLKNCNFDVSISSFHRDKIRDGITAMFDYDAIEAWITRNPDIENYKNYYDWAIHH